MFGDFQVVNGTSNLHSPTRRVPYSRTFSHTRTHLCSDVTPGRLDDTVLNPVFPETQSMPHALATRHRLRHSRTAVADREKGKVFHVIAVRCPRAMLQQSQAS